MPVEPCVIVDCGQLAPEDPALSQPMAADGDVYEDYPEDQDPVEGQDVSQAPPVALRIAKEVREVGNRLFKEGKYEDALHKYQSKSGSLARRVPRNSTLRFPRRHAPTRSTTLSAPPDDLYDPPP